MAHAQELTETSCQSTAGGGGTRDCILKKLGNAVVEVRKVFRIFS
jgi:hypothetical protein